MNSEFLSYLLPYSVKNWKAGWFYMGNHHLPLAMHIESAPKRNNRWEEEGLSPAKLEKI
jgi:hypothetical protein